MKQQGDGAGETSRTTNYELQGTGWATRAPVARTLQSVRQTCSCTIATCLYRFVRFPCCGIFTPPRTSSVNNELKQQCDGAGETSRMTNYEMHGKGWATRASGIQTLQSVRQTCPRTITTCPYTSARFPSCGIFTPTRTSPVNNELKQQGDGAGETSTNENYELHKHGWATRAPVIQTLQSVRQTCSRAIAT